MRVSIEQLAGVLAKSLSPVWLIAGDEPLLVNEAADAVRARARADGYGSRDLFVTERGFDWSELLASSQSLSLFSERRIIEVRMPSPRPGKEGGAVLVKLASDPAPDTVLLVLTTRPERDTWNAAWFKALEKNGAFVETKPVAIGRLPQWITQRATHEGLSIDADGAALLAERVEGNLLAAHQEIGKLAMLHPGGRIGALEVQSAVSNSARYDVFQLGEAALEGDAARSLRILAGLRAEGVEIPLVLWAVCRDLRALADARANPGASPGYGAQAERRAEILRRAVKRVAGHPLGPLFVAAARVDREFKGRAPGDAWTTLTGLVAAFAGARIPVAPAA